MEESMGLPAIEIVTCTLDDNANVTVRGPLHRRRNLTLIRSIDNIGWQTTQVATVSLIEA